MNIGFMPNNIDSETAHYFPYIRVVKYISSTYEGNIPSAKYKSLIRTIEKLKINDRKYHNAAGIIDVDVLSMALFQI